MLLIPRNNPLIFLDFLQCFLFPVVLAVASEESAKEDVALDLDTQASHHYDSYGGHVYGGEYDGHDGGKYSKGAELSGLAHSSAIQAKNAVHNQHTAGSQAAYGVKSSLASAALGVGIPLVKNYKYHFSKLAKLYLECMQKHALGIAELGLLLMNRRRSNIEHFTISSSLLLIFFTNS